MIPVGAVRFRSPGVLHDRIGVGPGRAMRPNSIPSGIEPHLERLAVRPPSGPGGMAPVRPASRMRQTGALRPESSPPEEAPFARSGPDGTGRLPDAPVPSWPPVPSLRTFDPCTRTVETWLHVSETEGRTGDFFNLVAVAANNGHLAAWPRIERPALYATWIDPDGALRLAKFNHRTLTWSFGSATTNLTPASALLQFDRFSFPSIWTRSDGRLVIGVIVRRVAPASGGDDGSYQVDEHEVTDPDDLSRAILTNVVTSGQLPSDQLAKYLTGAGALEGLYAYTQPGPVLSKEHEADRYARAVMVPVAGEAPELPQSPMEGPAEKGRYVYRQSDPSVCSTPDGRWAYVAFEQKEGPPYTGPLKGPDSGTRLFVYEMDLTAVAGRSVSERRFTTDKPAKIEWVAEGVSQKHGGDVCLAATNSSVYATHHGHGGGVITLLRKGRGDASNGDLAWTPWLIRDSDAVGDGFLSSMAVVAMPDGEERIALAYERTNYSSLFDSRWKTVELIMVRWTGGGGFEEAARHEISVPVTDPGSLSRVTYRIAPNVTLGPPEAEAALGYHPVDLFWLEFDPTAQYAPRHVRLRHRTYRFGGGCVS